MMGCCMAIVVWFRSYGVVSCRDSDSRMGVCLSVFYFHICLINFAFES